MWLVSGGAADVRWMGADKPSLPVCRPGRQVKIHASYGKHIDWLPGSKSGAGEILGSR